MYTCIYYASVHSMSVFVFRKQINIYVLLYYRTYFNTCHCTNLFRNSKKNISILSINNYWHYTKRMTRFLKYEEEKVKIVQRYFPMQDGKCWKKNNEKYRIYQYRAVILVIIVIVGRLKQIFNFVLLLLSWQSILQTSIH